MPTLLDIAPATETVSGVPVRGVSARGVAYLLALFPELRSLVTGREFTMDAQRLMVMAPEAIAAIIAVGCGYIPDGTPEGLERQTKAEAHAATLNVDIQAEFLAAIIRVSLPGGVGPFVERLERLGQFAQDGGIGKVPGTKSDGSSSTSPTNSNAA